MQSTLNATLPATDMPLAEKEAAVEKQEYRNAMARLGSAVNIITTDGPAVGQVSPPLLCAASPIRHRHCWCA